MLSIFAIPKPFKDHIAIIQRNAITSWTLLHPKPEIILFGNDEGTAEVCKELDLRHVPEVACNEFGTPLLNDIFEKAQQVATYDLLCYVNADMLLMRDFMEAMEQAGRWEKPFLMAGGRWSVEITTAWDFDSPDWEKMLGTLVQEKGRFSHRGIDYFAFPRGFYKDIPPLAIGRGYFDGWLISEARALKARVVDATPLVLAVHQDHDYTHTPAQGGSAIYRSEEGRRNGQLAKLARYELLREATHRLTPSGPERLWGRTLLFNLQRFLVIRLGPVRHALGLRRSNLRKIKHVITSAVARPK